MWVGLLVVGFLKIILIIPGGKGLNFLEQTVRSVLVSSYLVRDAAMVVVPHADPDWTLDFIRGRPRCVITFPI